LISTVTAHAGREIHQLALDLHARCVERDARRVGQLLALRLARARAGDVRGLVGTRLPRNNPYLVKLKVSTLISASSPASTKPMSLFWIIASISMRN
jgi:hypothetical protein